MGQYKNTLGQAIYDDLENNTYLKEIYENILYKRICNGSFVYDGWKQSSIWNISSWWSKT